MTMWLLQRAAYFIKTRGQICIKLAHIFNQRKDCCHHNMWYSFNYWTADTFISSLIRCCLRWLAFAAVKDELQSNCWFKTLLWKPILYRLLPRLVFHGARVLPEGLSWLQLSRVGFAPRLSSWLTMLVCAQQEKPTIISIFLTSSARDQNHQYSKCTLLTLSTISAFKAEAIRGHIHNSGVKCRS